MTRMTIGKTVSRLIALFLGVACMACFGPGWDDSLEGTGGSPPYSANYGGADSPDVLGNAGTGFFVRSPEMTEAVYVPRTEVIGEDDGEADDSAAPEETDNPGAAEEVDEPTDPEEVEESTDPEEVVEPTDPEEVDEPTDPEEVVEPTDPEETGEPTDPEETGEPEDDTLPAVCGDEVFNSVSEVCDGSATDDGCDGSSRCLSDCSACVERPHVMFTTSRQYTGDLVSEANDLLGTSFNDGQWRDAANSICQSHADEAGLSGTFLAILDATTDEGRDSTFDIIGDADGPWARLDGLPIADSVEELRSDQIRVPVAISETGGIFDNWDDFVWAGATNDCLDWTSDSPDDRGWAGTAAGVSNDWMSLGYDTCNSPHYLSCIEIGDGGASNSWPSPPDETQLVVFTTEESFGGDLLGTARQYGGQDIDDGREAADFLCDLSAQMGGLDGTFHAFLSGPDADVYGYFEELGMDGPWYTSDGFLAVTDLAELFEDAILVPFHADAAGNLLDGGKYINGRVWTGLASGRETGDHCNGWTSNDQDDQGEFGYWAQPVEYAWRSIGNQRCDLRLHLYCFQQM